MSYQPTAKSVKAHSMPSWYHHAKFGIFIHWGLYSVPAYAVTKEGDMQQIIQRKGVKYFYEHNPYAEWYLNSIRIPGSGARQYHDTTYGPQYNYEDFASIFNDKIKAWRPQEWADLFEVANARYAVITAKHHDGFALWPSQNKNLNITKENNYQASRDIVKELQGALTQKNIKMGIYYSGVLDWSFTSKPIRGFSGLVTNGSMSPEYRKYADAQWRELIDRYSPWILWNDIGYPPGTNINALFAYYYNKVPEGVVNDRWVQFTRFIRWGASLWAINAIASWMIQHFFIKRAVIGPTLTHCDYITPEYSVFNKILKKKWELTRGIGNSFGFNQFETDADYVDSNTLIKMLADIVSKNGNMLLNVGPKPDGTIPEVQKSRLFAMGSWLKTNGEAIFDTEPWIRAEGSTVGGIPIRFTQKAGAIFMILLDQPKSKSFVVKDVRLTSWARIQLLSTKEFVEWKQDGLDLQITLPTNVPESPAHCFKIDQSGSEK